MIPEGARFTAGLIENLGRRNGHTFGGWQLRDVEGLPEVPGVVLERELESRLALECLVCGAHAVIVTDDGAHYWQGAFAKPCPTQPKPPEAA